MGRGTITIICPTREGVVSIRDAAVDPIARFEAEHREALSELDLLEEVVNALECGESLDRHAMKAQVVLSFLKGTVQRHCLLEEQALYALIEDQLPTTSFADDHSIIRSLERELAEALEPPEDCPAVVRTCRRIIEVLRDHIGREEEVLFPMARKLLGADGLARVAELVEAEEV